MKHECIIGALFLGELELVTLEDVKKYVAETKDINRQIDEHPIYHRHPEMKRTEWTWAQYADKRVNTNLRQFDFCPECGKKINWKGIRRLDND